MNSPPLVSDYTLAAAHMADFIAMVPRQGGEDKELSSLTPDAEKTSSDPLRGMPKESTGMIGKY